MSQLFVSGGQSIGISASTSVLPMNTQEWSPLGWTVWISFQSKGLSRVLSNTSWAHEPGTLVKIWQETCIWEPSALKNHNNFDKKSLQKYIPLDHLRHFLVSGKYIKNLLPMLIDVVVQSTSCVWFFATPWMDSSRAGSSILHCLPQCASIHVPWVGDVIQPSHPLSSSSPPALNLSQHQGLFKWVSSSLQHQYFQWTPRTDVL